MKLSADGIQAVKNLVDNSNFRKLVVALEEARQAEDKKVIYNEGANTDILRGGVRMLDEILKALKLW